MKLTQKYNSLEDIRYQKEMLQIDLYKNEQQIAYLWKELLKPAEALQKNASTSKRLIGLFNVGTNILDGAILGWKLYKKFR